MNAPLRQRTFGPGRPWTPAEDAILRARYKRLRRTSTRKAEAAALLRALPGRTRDAIANRAQKLGVTWRHAWTPAEDRTLRDLWPDTGARTIRQTLRGRSWTAIRARAFALGLGARWQGYVSIDAAATRLGYHSSLLHKILERYGVRVVLRGGKTERASRFANRVVLLDDAREAVEKWERTETPQESARRYGVSGSQMRRWLRDAGLLPQSVAGSRAEQRLDVDEIARALAKVHAAPPSNAKRRPALDGALGVFPAPKNARPRAARSAA